MDKHKFPSVWKRKDDLWRFALLRNLRCVLFLCSTRLNQIQICDESKISKQIKRESVTSQKMGANSHTESINVGDECLTET